MAEDMPLVDLTQLVADHHAALYRYAFRLTGSAADAEDLTQQTFLIAHRRLEQLRSADSARSWLFTVLRNAFLKSCQKNAPLPAAEIDLSLESIPDETSDAPLVDSDELQAAIDALPAEFKIVVLMFYFEHRSYREIAEQLALPPGTVMSRLSRAKSHLRQRLVSTVPAAESPPRMAKPARFS
jgi:RNA polymerase sigma-70 factor (ECF subfamily)